MSFADLKTARKAKETVKSYVKPNTSSPSSTTIPTTSSPEGPRAVQGLYPQLPSSLEIRSSQSSGRGLYAKQVHFQPGQVLFATKPHVSVLSNQYLDLHCSWCSTPAPATGLKRCTQCQVVWYCSSTCQNHDWSMHKNECAAIHKWAASAPSPDLAVPNDAIRCLGRIMWKRKKLGPDSTWSREIEEMQSHRSSLQSSSFELHTHLAHSLIRYLGVSEPSELVDFGCSSSGNLVDIISRFVTNTFTLTTPSLTPIGVSISPLIALINHSCEPNAVIVFPRPGAEREPLMHVVALRPIPAGTEILTAYIDTTLPRVQRQKSLLETYSFNCACSLCSTTDVDLRESMFCPKSCGGTCRIPTEEDSFTRCLTCKAVVSSTDAVLDAVRIGQEALDKATVVQFSDPAKAVQLTSKLIPILTSAHLAPASHPLLALTRLHQTLLISSLPNPMTQEALDDVIRTAAKACTGLSDILYAGHPVRGIALAELGKLLAVDEPAPALPSTTTTEQQQTQLRQTPTFPPSGPPRLKLAYDTLLRARSELFIGFGTVNEGGVVGEQVRAGVVELEKEIGVWKQGVRNVREDAAAAAVGSKST